jgi:succinate dehydrogenase/fumarate reductase flavoprotein subunit
VSGTTIDTDVLIIGSGFAGLWAAIAAREAGVARVDVVDKAAIAMSSQSRMAAGATIYCLPGDDAL